MAVTAVQDSPPPIPATIDVGAGSTNRYSKEGRDHPIPSQYKNTLTVVVGEFCGTFMFLLLSFIGTQAALDTNNPSDLQARPLAPFSLMYIAASFGTALAVNVWIFFRVTGGMFNPAVTLGLVLVGAVSPLRGLAVFPTQIVAGIAAAAVADGLLPGPLGVANTLGDGTSIVRGLFIEMFLTAQLVLTVYFLAVEKHRATFLAPIGIGLAVFIAHICGTNFTGTGINPARSFGPAVITGFTGYQWIYWLGPFMGSGVAYGLYTFLTWVDYKTANPGQDDDDLEKGRTHHSPERPGSGEKRPLSRSTDGTAAPSLP
ncbi:Major intrinsic protein [Cordyceps fumosorosea ARSEF 2679]|uniref:Major intrinsic protein n=1 Tax=Cordyceps fumosorosea (strain ARSEF 2679) TaxID=1081104 RepID=A0A167VTY9_CORFA|nr:Major intrinsic protein [Cordyceps fumosorosea ARSEF 2679]OAA62977.1 Major intrinsic protein [Cordyceps fumosorosea ARSEF 2679]